jgi:hypothetical protein
MVGQVVRSGAHSTPSVSPTQTPCSDIVDFCSKWVIQKAEAVYREPAIYRVGRLPRKSLSWRVLSWTPASGNSWLWRSQLKEIRAEIVETLPKRHGGESRPGLLFHRHWPMLRSFRLSSLVPFRLYHIWTMFTNLGTCRTRWSRS